MSEKDIQNKTQTNQPAIKKDSGIGQPVRGFNKNFSRKKKDDAYQQKILDVARVTRVMAGGKRMSFRVCLAIGDEKGKVGVGVAKGADIALAVKKATRKAEKNMVLIPTVNGTIPHNVMFKYGASKILFKPAKEGKGVIAGGVVRVIFELAGVKNVTSKILGTNNKTNNAKCTIEALKTLRKVEQKSSKNKGNNKELK